MEISISIAPPLQQKVLVPHRNERNANILCIHLNIYENTVVVIILA